LNNTIYAELKPSTLAQRSTKMTELKLG